MSTMTSTVPDALKMLIDRFVPNWTTTAFGWAAESLQFTLLASGRAAPVGYTVRNDAAVPPVAVTFNATPVASTGTLAASDSVTVTFGPNVLMGLAAWRVSSTRTGTVGTNDDALPSLAEATTTPAPPKATTAIAAPNMAQRDWRDGDFMGTPIRTLDGGIPGMGDPVAHLE